MGRIARVVAACAGIPTTCAVVGPWVLSTDAANRVLCSSNGDGLHCRSLQLSWWQGQQSMELVWPAQGIHRAVVQCDASLLGLLYGATVRCTVRVQGRGASVSAEGSAQLVAHQWGVLIGRLVGPATATMAVESTSDASVEALEEIAAIHPWLADLLMAGGADELTSSVITIDAGSQVQLLPRCSHHAGAVRARGNITGRAEHPMTLRFAGSWVNEMLRSLASVGLGKRGSSPLSEEGCRNSQQQVALPVKQLAIAHSELQWSLADGVVTFSRADMQINRTLTLASWGSYQLGKERRVDANVALTADTLRHLMGLDEPRAADQTSAASPTALLANDEGVVVPVRFLLPEAPPRGYYLAGGKRTREMKVDWVRAIDWSTLLQQLTLLLARRAVMASADRQASTTAHSDGKALMGALLAGVGRAIVSGPVGDLQVLPTAPEIPHSKIQGS